MYLKEDRDKANEIISDLPPEQQEHIRRYIASLEFLIDSSFNLLANDNYYSDATNEVWTRLGKAIGKISSDQVAFEREVEAD